ncbi:MAG: DAK2 domain-containing protein [Candidatus Dormibacteraeota bacterium]|nr:DAK2 domain-containing protein [Candidatus Dormibacteraeota bacterium]
MADITRVDGVLYKRSLFGSHAWLKENRDKVNELNVFPVPDGDTGTNMLLTLEAACEELGEDNSNLADVTGKVAHGALMGARGNSGVILSQILRGFSQGVVGKASVDCRELALAFEEATKVAYKGVTKPTEGTILTVARAVSDAALARAEETNDVAELIATVVGAAQRAVDETPSQLAVLREAGVVDAGGYGLMVILEGFLKTVKGSDAKILAKGRPSGAAPADVLVKVGAHALETPEEGWGFCTEFLIEQPSKPFEVLREELTPMGNSAVIVGDDSLVRVHIHTLDPGSLITHATAYGALQKLKVEDMTRQHHEILANGDPSADDMPIAEPAAAEAVDETAEALNNGHGPVDTGGIGVVAVAVGDGFRKIFEGIGAGVVEGGQTMNPSTEDLLQAVQATEAGEVIILPNNKNVIMTAQQVSDISDKPVRVVPSRTVPQGISALLNLDPGSGLEANADAMGAALKGIQTIEVTRAVRSTSMNGLKIKNGDIIAMVNGKLKGAGVDEMAVIDGAIDSLKPDGYELLTIYGGAGVSDEDIGGVADHLRERLPNLTVETQRGEQEHYPYILSLE